MWFVVLSVVIVLFILLNIIFPKQYHRPSFNKVYDAIPGPLCVPYFGNMWAFAAQKEDLIPNLIKRLDKFRPVMKCDFMGFTAVYLTKPEDLEVILSSKIHLTKGYLYEFIRPWLGDGLLLNTGKKWFDHRKILTPAFHLGILEQYVDIFNKNSNDLVDHIKENLDQDYIGINTPISLCALDIICETAMGTRVNALKGGQKEFVQAIFRMGELNQKRTLSPWLYRDWCFYISPIGFEQRKVLKLIHGFSEKVIKERKAAYLEQSKNSGVESNSDEFGSKKKISFLDLMIHCSETENKLTEKEIREEVDTFMFEGHDTTQVAISWALYELAQNPEIQNKAYQELKDIFGDSDRNPSFADLNEMKYLERVIKESLRKHPSVPLISRRLEENVTIKNHVIPAGTDIIMFIYYLHMDPQIYPEPEKFNPDRFLPEAFCGHHPYSYIPFSAGPRNCIGQKFAIMEEKIIISQILRNFEMISLDDPNDVLPLAELVLRSQNDFKIKFRLRK